MHDILDLPEVRACVSRMSVARYHETPEFNENGKRTELIRGIVIEKMSKTPLHATICRALFRTIEKLTPEGLTVWKDEPLTFVDSEPEPDVSVVQGSIEDRIHGHPGTAELAVEVAVTSLALDREKAAIYAEAGVREYWIVIPKQQQVEVYRRPEGGLYREQRVYSLEDTLTCESLPAITIAVRDIFPA